MSADWVRERVVHALRESATLCTQLSRTRLDVVLQGATALHHCISTGGKVILFGNGGSAADAQHIAAEFVGRFVHHRPSLPAIALTTNTSVLTSISNDYGFEQVFARQVEGLGRPGDVVIAISTSGRSPNVIAGVLAARKKGLSTIGLTGGDGGDLATAVDLPIVIPSSNTPRIQECHITVGHILCDVVEKMLFQADDADLFSRGNLVSSSPGEIAKIVDWETLLSLRRRWRREGKKIVWTNGCFDLLHVGHVRSRQGAKKFGDILVVGVNSDESVRRLKGPDRPIMPAEERIEVLSALEVVDYVIVFSELTPEIAVTKLQPDIHCKGADYAPPAGKPVPEAKVVASYGGRIEYLPLYPGASTSDIIRRIRGEVNKG